jgi:solute carrier family 25 protein 38
MGGASKRAVAAAAPPPPPRSKLASVASGSLSGMLVSACLQPLDVVRTRMQADAARGVALSSAATARAVAAEGGLAALWRGTQPTVIRLGLGAGLHFFFLDSLRPALEARFAAPGGRADARGRPELTALGAALAGGLSRAAAALAACPITVAKTRMEYVASPAAMAAATASGAALPRYRNTAHALATIARLEGARGLFRGVAPTVAANAPFSALYYMFYTRLQARLRDALGVEALPAPANFAAGAAAAVAATLLTQPADVVRTRMQLGLGAAGGGSLALLRGIFAAQGARGLLAGAAPRMAKRTMQTALVWTLYEELVPRLTAARAWAAARAPSA